MCDRHFAVLDSLRQREPSRDLEAALEKACDAMIAEYDALALLTNEDADRQGEGVINVETALNEMQNMLGPIQIAAGILRSYRNSQR